MDKRTFGAVSVEGFGDLQKRLEAISDKGQFAGFLKALGLAAVREAKVLVPRKTGNLGRSIKLGRVTPTSVRVQATAGYAAFVELGTRPHEIRPVRARVLAWGGARRLSGALRSGSSPTNFAMVVHHPGTRPQPYLLPGAKRAVAGVGVEAIVGAWNRAAA